MSRLRRARPAREDEVPKFGSMWSYGGGPPHYMAIGVHAGRLIYVEMDSGDVASFMMWSTPRGKVLTTSVVKHPDGGWWCHDE